MRLGARGKVRVAGTIRGVAFESTAVPNGDGTHSLLVTRAIRASANVRPGERVQAWIVPVLNPRPPRVPTALRRALQTTPAASRSYRALAPSHRRAWCEFVATAKRPETRERRARLAVARLLDGLHRPDDPGR